ncbi:MAG TPA: TonB family protein, partial [Longimicrobiaceae bacterium]|nr:TonB family protein [Longimicrobiaceae bacterium]
LEPKQPAPKSTPAPKTERPAEKPRATPPEPAPKRTERAAEPPKSTTPTPTPKRAERPQEAAQKDAPRKTEAPAARNPVPPKGRNPDPASVGGEGLAVRTEGAEFVDPAYLANIIRQLKRYFRPPPGSRTDEAEVQFWINRDGSVSDITIGKSRGSFQFRAAAMEAVEQAGLNKAFGPLPRAYRGNRLPVSFTFEPES